MNRDAKLAALEQALLAMRRDVSPDGRPNAEGFLLGELGGSAAEQRLRAFYEEVPYRRAPASVDLAHRIERLGRDWSGWMMPVTLAGQRTMDVGCGCGHNLALHAALAAVAVGLDVSLSALREARRYLRECGLGVKAHLVHGDVCCLRLPPRSFDVITCIGVLHHVPDTDAALASMARLLDEGGLLLLGVYHPFGRFWHRLKRTLLRLCAGSSPADLVAAAQRQFDVQREARLYGIPTEVFVRDAYAVPTEKAFTVCQLSRKLARCGLELLQVRPTPAVAFRAPIERVAHRRREGERDRPIISLVVDWELGRLRRHHYWLLARRPPHGTR